ncbi:hypothetical protein [Cytobacillus massiliigabonensis]|uniref:hypothetical protein n=1 Tax=Cytobacillus massiliigabonensis TaxID=1871011 RepID=UPI000C83A0B2|nr:hypothetical protein [Cytobacillus massiliigabonensis]
MNIQQYYRKTASISLNVSLAALIPSFFLIIYGIMIAKDGRFVLIVLPFLVYSFFCYQYYLVCDRRSKGFTEKPLDAIYMNQSLLNTEQILVHFLPASSVRILFFSSTGKLIGELKERKLQLIRWFFPSFLDRLFEKRYGLYDELNNIIAIFHYKKRKIEIRDKDGKLLNIIHYVSNDRHMKFEFASSGEAIVVTRTLLYMDYQFFQNQIMVCRLQKGLMPLEWEYYIKDPNTPVLSFEQNLCEEEKINILAILSKILH